MRNYAILVLALYCGEDYASKERDVMPHEGLPVQNHKKMVPSSQDPREKYVVLIHFFYMRAKLQAK